MKVDSLILKIGTNQSDNPQFEQDCLQSLVERTMQRWCDGVMVRVWAAKQNRVCVQSHQDWQPHCDMGYNQSSLHVSSSHSQRLFPVWTLLLATKTKKKQAGFIENDGKTCVFCSVQLEHSVSLVCIHTVHKEVTDVALRREITFEKKRGDQTSEDQNNICGPSEKDFWDAIWPDYIAAMYIGFQSWQTVCVSLLLWCCISQRCGEWGRGGCTESGHAQKTHNVSQIKHRISAKARV